MKTRTIVLRILLYLTILQSAKASISLSDWAKLRSCVAPYNKKGGTLKFILPSNNEWFTSYNARFFNTLNIWVTPASFAVPQNEADLKAVLKCTDKLNIPISIRSGGHSYAGASRIEEGLLIDMSRFTKLKVDKTAQSITFGVGQLLGGVYLKARETQSFFAGGTCPGVGSAGFTLGGGYSAATRLSGFTIDTVLSLRGVTVSGENYFANSTVNSDLFWAMRGGGGTHAIATEFTVKTFPIYENYVSCNFGWSKEDRGNVMKSFLRGQPWKLDPNVARITLAVTASSASINMEQWGGISDAYMKSFLANASVPAPSSSSCQNMTWEEFLPSISAPSNLTWSDFPTPKMRKKEYLGDTNGKIPPPTSDGGPQPYKFASWAIDSVPSEEAFNTLMGIADTAYNTASKRTIRIRIFGGDVLDKIPSDAGAMGFRSAPVMLTFQSNPQGDTVNEDIAWVNQARDAMEKYSNGISFFNFMDCDAPGDKFKRYYGPNAPRSKTLKLKYDPKNRLKVFCNNWNNADKP